MSGRASRDGDRFPAEAPPQVRCRSAHLRLIPLLCAALGSVGACEPARSLATLASVGMPGLVNPSLQPADLMDRYLNVLCLEVTAIDLEARTVDLAVRAVAKGSSPAPRIRLRVAAESAEAPFQILPEVGLTVVAFVGQRGRGREAAILFYAGGEGRWQEGVAVTAGDAGTPAHWDWTADLAQELYGTFNGHPGRLAEMVRDAATGRPYFPATPFDRFREDLLLGRLAGGVSAVALHDVDADGRPDALAVGPGGAVLHLQREPSRFTDATASAGLGGVAGSSVDAADADGDGRIDLLIGAHLLRQAPGGRFDVVDLPGPSDPAMSRFVDIDADGRPEIALAAEDGVRILRRSDGAWTAAAPLPQVAAGALIPGDWRGDGRTALFVSGGRGILVERDDAGAWTGRSGLPGWDFTAGGVTGGGACAPVWRTDRFDLAFATDTAVNLVAFVGDQAVDVGRYGNETQVALEAGAALIAEDLNADGHVDLYATSRGPDRPNTLYVNRGYGSFMVATRYKPDVFPGSAHGRGGPAAIAGDADGDGANDLLLGSADGTIALVLNDVLAGRTASEHPTPTERVLNGTALLHVEVVGPLGVAGAVVAVTDGPGATVALRRIGGSVGSGCRGPDAVTVAIRAPGPHRVTVRWSDGRERSAPVALAPGRRTVLRMERGNGHGQDR